MFFQTGGEQWQMPTLDFPGGSDGKASVYNEGDLVRSRVGKIPWRRKWQPTPVLLPGKSHGQRSLIDYSPWGLKESDTTERLHFHFQTSQRASNKGNPSLVRGPSGFHVCLR